MDEDNTIQIAEVYANLKHEYFLAQNARLWLEPGESIKMCKQYKEGYRKRAEKYFQKLKELTNEKIFRSLPYMNSLEFFVKQGQTNSQSVFHSEE